MHYSTRGEWTNLDFVSTGKGVIAHNLLGGIPFKDNNFDLVYHSHVLEHFSKQDGAEFILECFRVLKPGGILRVVIPDLERIAREYLNCLEQGVRDPDDPVLKSNYEWMLIEMYDQTVRNKSGGNMGPYLFQEKIINEDFVFKRIGEEGRSMRNDFLRRNPKGSGPKVSTGKKLNNGIKQKLKNYLLTRWGIQLEAHELGKFRLSGEIHQWMYDRYSLTNLLRSSGGDKVRIQDAFTSYITDWISYELDGKDIVVRKPDSLFVEAIKK